ncbi:alpha-2,8-sialyltransferase 8F-like [Salarias fasciatus]|uniref:Alpha-2,8-sialyltransferase 8F-like n=1 Tax=Salarias fasciatus TaxID=181472 RepID=A0A672GMZ4_SALFA|nr:alpha-2,8-sialyltransferase 8F-like [Salarias fasciatus]
MRLQILKLLFSLLTIFFLGGLLSTLIWYMLNSNVESHRQPPHKKSVPVSSEQCKNCREIIANIAKRYAEPWKRQDGNYQKFSSLLSSKCHGAEYAIVTQNNTPLGSQIVYSGEAKRKAIEVTTNLFSTFPKDHPLPNKKWDSCSVVGNGGILVNSKCGKQIDSADFVIRCNLPPLDSELQKDVGKKTNLVTANPSIFMEKFHALNNHRRPFVESLRRFGDATLLMPTFSFGYNTQMCLRAVYAIEDFESPIRPVSFNPEYMRNLSIYWRSQGLKEARLSTGFIMVSLALELCNSVDLYGFWPFSVHPQDFHPLTNHYYDNRPPRKRFHSMPAEFDHLLKLHSQGILRLHLGECEQ